MRNLSMRKLSVSAVLVGTSLTGVALAGPASASSRSTYNRANVELTGGDARALSHCVNVARTYARLGRHVPSHSQQSCGGATAIGGSVVLDNANITIDQMGGGRRSVNTANVVLSGGDATAIAACLNYASGRATSSQRSSCAGARAQGGNVTLRDSNITVIQG